MQENKKQKLHGFQQSLGFLDCSNVTNSNLGVLPPSAPYNESGELKCKNDGFVFGSNDKPLTTNLTICNATAQWSRQNDVECYTGNGMKVQIYCCIKWPSQ